MNISSPSTGSQTEILQSLKFIINLVDTPILISNKDHVILLVNNALVQLCNLQNSEITGKTESYLWGPELMEKVLKTDKQLSLEHPKEVTCELVKTKNDELKMYSINYGIIPLPNEDNYFIKVLSPKEFNNSASADNDKKLADRKESINFNLFHNILQRAIKLTNSANGFLAIVDASSGKLNNFFWADSNHLNTKPSDENVFIIRYTDLWMETYRRGTVVLNNFYSDTSDSNLENKTSQRYLSIPSNMFNNLIAIISVFDKNQEYLQNDIDEIKRVFDSIPNTLKEIPPLYNSFDDSISKNKLIEERITNAQKLESIGILAGGMAHDFNNFLTGLLNYVNLAKLCTVSQQVIRYLDNAMHLIDDAQNLTRQFLHYSKYTKPNKSVININLFVKNNLTLMLSGTNIRSELNIDPELWSCEADEGQLNQVLGCLIINAREAMPDGGIISISAHNYSAPESNKLDLKPGNYVMLTISDTGHGITDDIKNKIFEPFFSTKPKGSGLGLTSVVAIMKNHEGHIDFVSDTPNGTTFTMYLPAYRNDTINNTSESNSSDIKILLMDDEHFIRHATSKLLKLKNYNVDTASNGEEAINLYKDALVSKAPYSMVILDLTIPDGLGGRETLKELLKLDPEVNAIASSGYSDDPVMSQPQNFGFKASLCKPYRLEEFLILIKNVSSAKRHS
jgi:signal transduction histidine kinase/CheY-like chemotaxis protein